MNILYLFLFMIGICFGAPAVVWLYEKATRPRPRYIREGIADAEAYANTAGIGDADYEAEWVRWLEDES